MTSGEGGMIICKNKKIMIYLECLDHMDGQEGLIKKTNNFNFINSGFNLRPTDIVASIGLSQLKKIKINKMAI